MALDEDMLTIEFPGSATFHRGQAEEPQNVAILRDTLEELLGHRLSFAFVLGETTGAGDDADEVPAGEEEIYQLVKETFDATEIHE